MHNQLLRWIVTPLVACAACDAITLWRVRARPRGFNWNGVTPVLTAKFDKRTPCACP